jgi:amidase
MLHAPKIDDADALRIGRLDAHDQAALLRSGEVSGAELVEAAIRRIEILDTAVNAVSVRAFDLARARAAASAGPRDGAPLAGVPYLIKDSLPYPGLPARAASRARGDAPSAAAYPFIRRFDDAGLIPVGKSTMAEFGLLVSNETLRYGATNNPWDLTRSPGGSSGGAAAAVAAGLTPLAHGSDAAGSIRVPAAACGLVGFKPSRGANLRARHAHWLDDLLCSDAMITRSVRDAAWAFRVASPDARPTAAGPIDRRLRIALVMDGMDHRSPHPAVAEALRRTAELCERLGHVVEDVARPPEDAAVLSSLMEVLWPFLGREAVDQCRSEHPGGALEDLLEPWTIDLAGQCDQVTPAALEAAFAALARAPAFTQGFFAKHDVMLTPTLAEPPVLTGELAPTLPHAALLERFMRFAPYTPLQNMVGSPAISLPLFTTDDGLPVGSMFAADRGDDDMLLALAHELEAAVPWGDRWPGIYTRAEAG